MVKTNMKNKKTMIIIWFVLYLNKGYSLLYLYSFLLASYKAFEILQGIMLFEFNYLAFIEYT